MVLLKTERQLRIRRLIERNGRATVAELSEMFGVSEATIRRDLEELDGEGWIRRTHGGAIRVERASREPPMLQRMEEQAEEKRRIGRATADLIRDGETVFLGSGTTVLEVARCLHDKQNLTVITNALSVVNELATDPTITLIVIGGLFRQSELSMIGHIAEQAIRELRADKAIMGMRAIDVRHGFTNDHLPETMTDRAIMEIAPEVIIVADHTKFGRVSTALVGPVRMANRIISDSGTPQDIIEELEAQGVTVQVV